MRQVTTPHEPYWELLPRLRAAHGLSQAELFRRAVGVGFDTIRALEQDPTKEPVNGRRSRARYPSPATLEALAAALNEEPTVFVEYRLARARGELDERIVGLDQAMENLDRIVTALRQRAVKRGATEVAQQARRRQEPPANPGEAASQEGA